MARVRGTVGHVTRETPTNFRNAAFGWSLDKVLHWQWRSLLRPLTGYVLTHAKHAEVGDFNGVQSNVGIHNRTVSSKVNRKISIFLFIRCKLFVLN